MADAFTSFDTDTAAGAADPTYGGAVPIEDPPELQRQGVLWPTPAEQVSDHSSEGAPWQPTARDVPTNPPQGPLWQPDHDGPTVAATSNNWQRHGQGNWHDGRGAALNSPGGRPNIGQPFTTNQGSGETRTLATDQWDTTGKRVNPPDAPSAPHELYGSQHMTAPRFIPFQVGALFENVADSNQFTRSPGYYGVRASVPDLSARPFGAVAAQSPSDPYVAGTPAPQPVAPQVDYGWDF